MKTILTLLFFILLTDQVAAQNSSLNNTLFLAAKKNAATIIKTEGGPFASNQISSSLEKENEEVFLLVKGNSEIVKQAVISLGGRFKFSAGDISSVLIGMNKVNEFSAMIGIERVEGRHGFGMPNDDVSLVNINLGPVSNITAPLTQLYDGAGVVAGLIDAGIDLRHPDFQNSDGTTRVKWIWDMNDLTNTNSPEPYFYGREWTEAELNDAGCTYLEHFPQSIIFNGDIGHGSNVTGLMAGNGSAVNGYYGVAPKADIICVDIVYDPDYLARIADAVNYIFDKAELMQLPCVVNISAGIYRAPHDGSDLTTAIIEYLLEEKNGRSCVVSAGNGGGSYLHLGYQAEADSLFTWFSYTNTSWLQGIEFDLHATADSFSEVEFSIGVDQTNPFQFLSRTPYHTLSDFNTTNGTDLIIDTIWWNSTVAGIAAFYASEYQERIVITVIVEQISDLSYYWRLMTKGNGTFNVWSKTPLTGTSNMVYSLPAETDFPAIVRYKMPDDIQSMNGSYTCSDHVISVGQFVNRTEYVSLWGNVVTLLGDTAGVLGRNSSRGPTSDGRIKPDITAPGSNTLTTGNLDYISDLMLSFTNILKIGTGGMHHRNGSTSMSAPLVGGIAALYLQKNPNSSWREVKDAILLSAYNDEFTGNDLPNNYWGYGKADAFGALTIELSYGCTDPFSLNFDPLANADDGNCIPIVFGCLDPNATNYNPAANMNDGSCEYLSGAEMIDNTTSAYFHCTPNLFQTSTTFYYSLSDNTGATRLIITDAFGKMVDELSLEGHEGTVFYNKPLASGIYFYKLLSVGNFNEAKKMIVY